MNIIQTVNAFKCRSKFDRVVKEVKNWFPGHMNRGLKDMQRKLNSIDCIIEVHDARTPLFGRNPVFHNFLTAIKPHVLVLNKVDLSDYADLNDTEEKRVKLKKEIQIKNKQIVKTSIDEILFTNCKNQSDPGLRKLVPTVIDLINNSNRYHRDELLQYSVMVIGVPNVGKSSLINTLRSKYMNKGKATRVGAIAGVTRSVLEHIKISIDPDIYVLDTPGVLAPQINNIETALRLAICGTFQDHLVGEELMADYLLYALNKNNQYHYVSFLGLDGPTNNITEALIKGAIHLEKTIKIKNLDGAGKVYIRPDIIKVAQLFLKAFRNGQLGNFTLN